MRTRLKTTRCGAAYERMSSSDSGRTDVSPRSVFTSTGKKQRTAAMTIFDHGESVPNHAFVIGANATIGTAFAAIMYGMSAFPNGRQRARTSAKRNAVEQPRTNPPNASLNVIHPARASSDRSSQRAWSTSESGGRRIALDAEEREEPLPGDDGDREDDERGAPPSHALRRAPVAGRLRNGAHSPGSSVSVPPACSASRTSVTSSKNRGSSRVSKVRG